MDKSILYPQEQTRGYDFVSFEHDVVVASSYIAQDLLGGAATMVAGVAATQNNPASLSLSISAGRVYQLSAADGVAQGSVVQDTTLILQQGLVPAQVLPLSTTGLSPGQSRWALVQATFQQSDVVRSVPASDPNSGVMAFYNVANPQQPLNGQNGNGGVLPTARLGVGTVSVVYGAIASSGQEAPPTASTGSVGLFLVDLSYGQTQIVNSQIITAGPSAGINVPSNYPGAPLLAGLLNSHHGGIPGQAPKINLNTETQGQIGIAQGGTGAGTALTSMSNMLVSHSSITAGYTVQQSDNNTILEISTSGTITLPALAMGTRVGMFINASSPAIAVTGSLTFYGNGIFSNQPFYPVASYYYSFYFDGANWVIMDGLPGGTLISDTVITSGSGTYIPPVGAKILEVEVLGGGGAGGGAAATGAGLGSCGAGGYSGALCIGRLAAAPTAYAVGVGGVGVSGSIGNSGGNSTFGTLTADGGTGGGSSSAEVPPLLASNVTVNVGASGGLINIPGEVGAPGFALSTSLTNGISGGTGGSTRYGGGGTFGTGTLGSSGNPASANTGAGGSGAALYENSSAISGSSGGSGIIRVRAYS